MNQRAVAWSGLDGWRAEFAEVELGADGLRAQGTQIGVDPMPYRAQYRLDAAAPGSVTRSLRVEVSGAGWGRRLRLERAASGEWTIEIGGEGAEDELPAPGGDPHGLAGAIDCDLAFSPLTNAMPVRRHGLDRGGSKTFLMAWVSLPDLAVTRSRQHYTHVSADEAGAVVRYESESRDFVAELEFDRDGLVRVYPQLARRVEPGEPPQAR